MKEKVGKEVYKCNISHIFTLYTEELIFRNSSIRREDELLSPR